jgi:hypothetical protein
MPSREGPGGSGRQVLDLEGDAEEPGTKVEYGDFSRPSLAGSGGIFGAFSSKGRYTPYLFTSVRIQLF